MNEQTQFLPFHAINEFMLTEYRREVIKTVLSSLNALELDNQKKINLLIKRNVKVPGFRNSSQAPLPMLINGAIQAFEKSASFSAQILSAWAELHPELRNNVQALLENRDWKILPEETDRTKLPGFLTRWPAEDSFEMLIKAFRETFPEASASDDDISLMIVWLSGRLPYEMVDRESLSTDN